MTNTVWIPAAIGAASALVVTLVKDLILPVIVEKRSKKEAKTEHFLEYVSPIVLALETLMWRLDEILNQKGRAVYLRSEGSGSQYAEYKRLSTVYRVCVAIAWFRAFERELLNVRPTGSGNQARLRQAMKEFQSALADGKSVELEKYDRLIELFGWQEKVPPEKRDLFSIQIENLLDEELGREKHKGLVNAPTAIQRSVVESFIKVALNLQSIPLELQVTDNVVSEAARVLSFRQAWIYRDWQHAIGDEMLVQNPNGPRNFSVIGYGDFERAWAKDEEWVKRVSYLVLDFDVAEENGNDARLKQLRGILKAVAHVIVELTEHDKHLRQAIPETLVKARELSQ